MKQIKTFLSTFLIVALAPLQALAADTPFQVPSDQIQLRKGISTNPKLFVGDFGLGASNPAMGINSSNELTFNKNIFSLGDAASSIKQLIANIGLGSANPRIRYNPSVTAWEFSTDGTNFDEFGSGAGGASGVNLLKNPGFESGIAAGWTNTGGTFAAVTSGANLLIGKGSATFTASASGQFFQSTAYATPNGLAGQSCAASITYKGGDAGLTVQVIEGASTIVASQVLAAVTIPTTVPLTYPCSAAGITNRLKVISSAATAIASFDQAFVGSNTLIQISQANYFGGVTIPRINNCLWTLMTTSSFQGLPADSDCTGAVYRGNASAPATAIPALKFASMSAGDYVFKVPSGLLNNAQIGEITWRVSDGTHHSTRANIPIVGTANTRSSGDFVVHITDTIQNATFEIQAADPLGTQNAEINNDLASSTLFPDFSIDVYYYPVVGSPGSGSIRPDTVANSWSGYHTNVTGWASDGSGNYADATAGGTTTLVQLTNTNFGTVTTAASSLPGITWSVSRAGKYKVCAGVTFQSNSSITAGIRLVDGSGGIVDAGRLVTFNGSVDNDAMLCGFQIASAVGAQTTKVQLAASGATVSIINTNVPAPGAVINWTIEPVDQQTPAPNLVNSVVSPFGGVMNVASASFAGDAGGTVVCNSDPCVLRAANGITSVNYGGSANYTVNFAAGTFSQPPVCHFTALDITSAIIASETVRPTTLAVGMSTWNAAGAQTDDGANIICIGPK